MMDQPADHHAQEAMTPQARLAASRRAIVRHMHKDEYSPQQDDAGAAFGDAPSSMPSGNWSLIKHAVLSWWRHHPANMALDVSRPFISRYASEHPGKLLALAAGIGALVVVTRPWRLVSLGGVLLAALKSADVSGAVLSMMSRSPAAAPSPRSTR